MRKLYPYIAILLLLVAVAIPAPRAQETSTTSTTTTTTTTKVDQDQDDYDDDNNLRTIYFGPQIGVSKSPDEEPNLIGGAALRLRLHKVLGLEGSINYHQESFADDALTVKSWPIQVTGMLYPLPYLYGSMGAGWYMTTLDYDPDIEFLDDDTSDEFGWHFGGGVELPINDAVHLTGDLRYVFIDYDFEGIPGIDEDVDSNFFMATAGLLFGF